MTERTGQCLCGAVKFRLTAEPLGTRVCWCRDCQRIAANGTVNMVMAAEHFEVSGETSVYLSQADSGNRMSRHFCPRCGSHLFASSSARPQFRVVRVGALDDPSTVAPSANIWTRSAPAWACMDPGLESFAQQPPAPPAAPKS